MRAGPPELDAAPIAPAARAEPGARPRALVFFADDAATAAAIRWAAVTMLLAAIAVLAARCA
jgi:hypothetical protein